MTSEEVQQDFDERVSNGKHSIDAIYRGKQKFVDGDRGISVDDSRRDALAALKKGMEDAEASNDSDGLFRQE